MKQKQKQYQWADISALGLCPDWEDGTLANSLFPSGAATMDEIMSNEAIPPADRAWLFCHVSETTVTQAVGFGILAAMEVCTDPAWRDWASKWISDEDRTDGAAAERAAWEASAASAARAAAWAAAWAAEEEATEEEAAVAWAAEAARAASAAEVDAIDIFSIYKKAINTI